MLKITHIYRFGFLQKALLFLGLFLALGTTGVFAQFAVTEDFRGAGNPDILIGDDAALTSGNVDPVNQGWLRLTPSDNYKQGYAYINKSFPSTLGVLVDFEYKMWRNVADNTYNGADGIGVFLFDGIIDENTFTLGGYGGSLGYAPKPGESAEKGLSGGYVGIGIDAYGNFANPGDGPKRGGPGERPNSIVMRGPTTNNDTNGIVGGVQPTNRYLSGKTITTADGVNFNYYDMNTANDVIGVRTQNAIDWNTSPFNNTRIPDANYYRRIQIEIKRLTTGGQYEIIVRWKTSSATTAVFKEITRYTTNDVPPGLLKLGFAASTAGGLNFHEIRNLLVTTPNNVRVVKRANKDFLRRDGASGTVNAITYTIEITNDTDFAAPAITFLDHLTDGDGNAIAKSNGTTAGFYINPAANVGITTSGFTSTNLTLSTTTNDITGTVALAANSTGTVTIVGKLINTVPEGNLLVNTVTATPPYEDDDDLNNNTSTVKTPVNADGTDLMLVKTDLDDPCIENASVTKNFELRVSNIGQTAATYRGPGSAGNRIVITKTVANSLGYNDTATPGGFSTNGANTRWARYTVNILGNTTYYYVAKFPYSTTANQSLAAGATYETLYPIKYSLTIPANTGYTDTATVSYISSTSTSTTGSTTLNPQTAVYTGSNVETTTPTDNRLNNEVSSGLFVKPAAPVVNNVYYCQGSTASQLTATKSNSTYTLKWYFSLSGGFSSDFAPTPTTESAAAQSYWVSQMNGTCEGPRSEIKVFVSTTPTAGGIAGNQNICNGNTANTITSQTDGTIGAGTIAYRWERSTNGGTSWATITGATGATYAPGALTTTTLYRRYTVSTNGPGTATPTYANCESPATNTVTITVSAVPTPGTLTADQSLCYNTPAGAITTASGAANAPTGTGTLTYKWESATATGSFGVITGVSAESYTPPGNNTVTMRYRRSTIATNGAAVCTSAVSNIVTVYVQGTVDPGSITANQTICPGSTPTALTSTAPGTSPTTGAGISYRWESSINAGGAWSAAASSTNTVGYTFPGAVSQTTYYRRITISTYMGKACEAPSGNVIITAALPTAGSISANQIICKNSAPTLLTSAAGGAGTGAGNPTTYQWYSSNDPVNNFSAIGGANSETYQAGALGGTTYYVRTTKTTTNGLTCESARTAAIKITVVEFPNPGSLNTPDKYACNGVAPTPITSNTAGSATDGAAISYRWQQTTDAAATVWSGDIPGAAATGPDYAPGPLTQTTIFRRYTIATYPNAECRSTAATNEIKVNVSAVPTSGSIKGDQVVCSGTTPNNILNDQQGTGSSGLTYLWQTSTNNVDWDNVSTTNPDYQPPGGITVTTYYRRFGISSNGGAVCTATVPSNVVTVIVPVTTAGTIVANQTICSGTAPQLLTSSPGGAGTGTNITYKWQVSSNGGAWGDVATNGTGETYQPGNLTVNTQYRRVTTSTVTKGNANCSTATSNTITITVTAAVIGGTIGSDQAICYNTTPPANLTSSGAINPGTYRWESSTDGNSWSNTGVTTTGYTFTAPLIKTTYYRRVTVSGSCEGVSNTVTIYVAGELTAGSISGNQNICMDSLPGTIGPGTAGGGTGIYYKWEMSVNNGANWSVIANATQASYQPPVIHKTTQYRRTTVSTSVFGAFTVVCESATTAGTVIVTARNCKVITNPMIYQKVKN